MPTCEGTCKTGAPCHFKARRGLRMCGKHATQEHPTNVVGCQKVKTNGEVCGKAVHGEGTLCPYHVRVRQTNQERHVANRVIDRATRDLWMINADPDAAREIIVDAFVGREITRQWFEGLMVAIEREIEIWQELHVPRGARVIANLKGDLHKLAVDSQNVHTGPVAKQTTDGLKTLLEMAVPPTQDTLTEIDAAWSTTHAKEKRRVLDDMYRWYVAATCREDGDFLYKRALDGLWCRIHGNPELVARLWEEAVESRGVCCEGHLSRLCNVLVGFDDAFLPPVSIGELLQQKMSAIAEMDIRVEHKVGEAWGVFEELGIPMDERMPWLEAF